MFSKNCFSQSCSIRFFQPFQKPNDWLHNMTVISNLAHVESNKIVKTLQISLLLNRSIFYIMLIFLEGFIRHYLFDIKTSRLLETNTNQTINNHFFLLLFLIQNNIKLSSLVVIICLLLSQCTISIPSIWTKLKWMRIVILIS